MRNTRCSPEWRTIPVYVDYEVSDQGKIRHRRRKNELAGGPTKSGHIRVTLSGCGYGSDGVPFRLPRWTTYIHHLVCLVFHGPRPPGMETRHLNGDPADNRLENVVWGTRLENAADRVRHGRHHLARRTKCPRGHRLIEANLCPFTLRGSGSRTCLACKITYQSRWARGVRKSGVKVVDCSEFKIRADAEYKIIMGGEAVSWRFRAASILGAPDVAFTQKCPTGVGRRVPWSKNPKNPYRNYGDNGI